MSGAPITLLHAAVLGLDAMQRELAGILEASCLLDADHQPQRDTLPADEEDEISDMENAIELVKRAIAAAQVIA